MLGVTQILCFALGGNANFSIFRYQHVGIGNAKSLCWGLPNARPRREGVGVAVEYRLYISVTPQREPQREEVEYRLHWALLRWAREYGLYFP